MTNRNNLLAAYAQERMGREYGFRWSGYTEGYHRGQDVRKQNERRTASVVTDVIAISAGTVVYVGRPNKSLQLTIVIDTGRKKGRYESHSHTAEVAVKVGDKVESGQRLARNARLDERPGLIDGIHDHITITDYPDGAWNTKLPSHDPLPFIRSAIAAVASVDKPVPFPVPNKPTPAPEPEEEEDEMAKNESIQFVQPKEGTTPEKRLYAVFNTQSGFLNVFGSGGAHAMAPDYLASTAKAFGLDNPFPVQTYKHYLSIKDSLARIQPKAFPGKLEVDLTDAK